MWDLIEIFNSSAAVISGYAKTDLTDDNFTDVSDLIIAYNNVTNNVGMIRP